VSAQTLGPKHQAAKGLAGLALATQWAGNWKRSRGIVEKPLQQEQRDYGADYFKIATIEHGWPIAGGAKPGGRGVAPAEQVVSYTRQRWAAITQ
jgi:hypothetical protein